MFCLPVNLSYVCRCESAFLMQYLQHRRRPDAFRLLLNQPYQKRGLFICLLDRFEGVAEERYTCTGYHGEDTS